MGEILIGLVTLAALEIVLGIDNIIMVAIMAGQLPPSQQSKARRLGIALAMVSRIILLLSLSLVSRMETSLFMVAGHDITIRDLILFGGGLFLMGKSAIEIRNKVEGSEEGSHHTKHATLRSVIAQIALLDIIFSLDSVITAVGMVNHVPVMIAAVVIAVVVMLVSSDFISKFINEHPALKILAFSFLILVGFSLMSDALGAEIPKGYIYFSMFFSTTVQFLVIWTGRHEHKKKPAINPDMDVSI